MTQLTLCKAIKDPDCQSFKIGPLKLESWNIEMWLIVSQDWTTNIWQLEIQQTQYFPCLDCDTDTSYSKDEYKINVYKCKCGKLKQIGPHPNITNKVHMTNTLSEMLEYIKEHYSIQVILGIE